MGLRSYIYEIVFAYYFALRSLDETMHSGMKPFDFAGLLLGVITPQPASIAACLAYHLGIRAVSCVIAIYQRHRCCVASGVGPAMGRHGLSPSPHNRCSPHITSIYNLESELSLK